MKKWKFLVKFLVKVLSVCGLLYLLLTYVIGLNRISGNNMFPSMKDGDLGIFYLLDNYYSGDIVQYIVDGKIKVGRIIAVPGQEVNITKDEGYTVDGYQPNEEIVYPTYQGEGSDIKYPVELKDEEYFIMNDFRTDTVDSREYGVIKKEQLKGKLIFLLRRRNF